MAIIQLPHYSSRGSLGMHGCLRNHQGFKHGHFPEGSVRGSYSLRAKNVSEASSKPEGWIIIEKERK